MPCYEVSVATEYGIALRPNAMASNITEAGDNDAISAALKEIRVLTDDLKSNRRLTIAVTIPQFAAISPSSVL